VKPKSFMLIAGEASGDMLAAELVLALRTKVLEVESAPTNDVQPLRTELAPRFFGAGGPRMAAAGVELAFDMTQHSVIGISDVLKNYFKFRRLFRQLFRLAIERQPDVIIGVDYGGFNLRFGHAIKNHVRRHRKEFVPWNPKIVQYVSPQVWASRPGRAYQLAEDYDLLLSIFPFEKAWYAKRVPKLRVEFVGHPMAERFTICDLRFASGQTQAASIVNRISQILLLPGSRASELQRHLPVMLGALNLIREKSPTAKAKMVLPDEQLVQLAKSLGANVEIQIGDLPQALTEADAAIASTGTVTMECAFFGVPTVTLYKTSWSTYQIAKRIVTVKWLTMPNILADEEMFPEFVQNAATPENIASAALELLQNKSRRARIKRTLAKIVASLGGPGASSRAAAAIVALPEKPVG
jgi:lipid-A-disaccharide synthase